MLQCFNTATNTTDPIKCNNYLPSQNKINGDLSRNIEGYEIGLSLSIKQDGNSLKWSCAPPSQRTFSWWNTKFYYVPA